MHVVNIKGRTLPEAYENALQYLAYVGTVKYNEDWGKHCKEVNLVMNVHEPLTEPMISMLSVATPESLQKYLMEMLDGLLDWSIGIATPTGVLEPYTYHDRIMQQYNETLNEIKRSKHTRRACISVRTQEDAGSSDPACLQHIQFYVDENKLNMYVLFRSNDALRATFMNAFALIMLQKKALEDLRKTYPDLQMGEYIHHANSFHAYADNDGTFSTLEHYAKRVNHPDAPGINRADYVGDWDEMMEEYVSKIIRENNAKKAQYGIE